MLTVGIAYDLKSDFAGDSGGPDDRFEEYDSVSTVDAIAAAIESLGHRAKKLGGGRRFVEAVLEEPPDLVFNFAEGQGSRSREAHVPAVLEMLRVPFTHSDPLALAVSLDKAMCKRLVESAGVPTPRFAVVENVAAARGLELAYPLIAKPLFEGSSMGIRRSSRVTNQAALERELERLLHDYQEPVLVEEFLSGPELTVGILGSGAEARVFGMMEITPREGSAEEFVYSVEVKRNFEEEVRYVIPPERPASLRDAAAAVALGAFRALGCRDLARVDLRVGADQKPYFLEVNPVPGLDPNRSDIVILAKGLGMTYEQLIGGVIDSARKRYPGL